MYRETYESSESFNTARICPVTSTQFSSYTKTGVAVAGAQLTALVRTKAPDAEGHVDMVNWCISQHGGRIEIQHGHKIEQDFELVTVFTTDHSTMMRLRAAIPLQLKQLSPTLVLLAEYGVNEACRRTYHETWTYQADFLTVPDVLSQIASLLGHFGGNIRVWSATPYRAAFCGTEYTRLEALIDFSSTVSSVELGLRLDEIMEPADGAGTLRFGVELN